MGVDGYDGHARRYRAQLLGGDMAIDLTLLPVITTEHPT